MLHHMTPIIDYASAYSNWLNLWLNLSDDNKELAICGSKAVENVKKINAEYLPHLLIAGTTTSSKLPFLENRFMENEDLFYVCQNKTCLLPSHQIDTVLNDLIL